MWNQFYKGRSWVATLCVLLAGLFVNTVVNAKSVQLDSGLATPVLESGKTQRAYLRVALTGFEMEDKAERPVLNVALVLDQSGSMSGEKIARAKEAATLAVSKLNKNDIVSIITYDSRVSVLVPATRVTDKGALYEAIQNIRANGSTALFAGTSKGAAEVRKFLNKRYVNRVVLLSDGMANVGPNSPAALGQLGKALAKEGMSVSTIGLGLGYNEDLMTQLANYSDGNHDFVENSADLARVFDREFGDAMSVVAQDVEIDIICDHGVTPIRVVGRDAEIVNNRVRTRINQLYSSQQSHVVLEVEVPASKDGVRRDVANVQVKYNNMATQKIARVDGRVAVQFSESKAKVKAAINKTAYEDVIEQVANVEAEEALELRDQGNVQGAVSKLKSNATFLEKAASLISSSKLRAQSDESVEEAAAVEQDKNWNKTRKVLKEKVYKRAKQQAVQKKSLD